MKTNDMKRNHSNRRAASCRRAICLLAWLLLPAGALFAQQAKTNLGVNMSVAGTGLFDPENFIYYGHYKHALTLKEKDRGVVDTRESTPTPILWRVMGEESSDGHITLLSEYVLDSWRYGTPNQLWGNSDIHSQLNGTFTGGFTAAELGEIPSVTVYAPAYDPTNPLGHNVSASSISSNTKFYIPWGTPNQGSSDPDQNKVFWTLGASNGAIPSPTYEISTGFKSIGLKKGTVSSVYYWLRPRLASVGDYMLLVKADGDINLDGVGVNMGVRPIFKLDTMHILFAAEVMQERNISRVDQIEAIADYLDEDMIPNGGHGGMKKAFKLTLETTVAGSPAISGPLEYDLDEVASNLSDTVAVKPGEVLGFDLSPGAVTNASGVAYKIVRNNAAEDLSHYGYEGGTNPDSVYIVADNIYTREVRDAGNNLIPNPDYSNLTSGWLYTTSLWAQKNNPTQSNEGSTPLSFTLYVLNDNTAPTFSNVSAVRHADHSATVKFEITESNQKGKYYYVVDPTPTELAQFESFSLSPFPAKNVFSSAGEVTIPPSPLLSFGDNNVHKLYVIAKDQVRNVSNVLAIDIPVYVTPVLPTPIMTDAELEEGATVTFDVYEIADDANLPSDVLTITAATSSDPLIASVSWSAGSLSITGVSPGIADIDIDVTDTYPGTPALSMSIHITVREVTPQITIDYILEELKGFLDYGDYSFNGGATVEADSVPESIPESWFGTTVSIVRVNANPAFNSIPQQLNIPPRPAPPTVQAVKESILGFNDGLILGVNDSMEYRMTTPPDALWTPLRPGEKAVTDLSPGDYNVRYRAIVDKSFTGLPDTVTVGWGMTVPELARAIYLPAIPDVASNPSPGIHYAAATGDFIFSLRAGVPLRVTTNRTVNNARETLTGTPNANGGYDYIIRNVSGSIPVVIYILPDPPDAVETAAKQTVWTHGGRIYVQAWPRETVSVYDFNGRLVRQMNVDGELASIPIERGMYVVLLRSGARYKVMVR